MLDTSDVLRVVGCAGMPALVVGAVLRNRGGVPRLADILFHLGMIGLACFGGSAFLAGLATGEIEDLGESGVRMLVRARNPRGFWFVMTVFAVFAVTVVIYSTYRIVQRSLFDRRPEPPDSAIE